MGLSSTTVKLFLASLVLLGLGAYFINASVSWYDTPEGKLAREEGNLSFEEEHKLVMAQKAKELWKDQVAVGCFVASGVIGLLAYYLLMRWQAKDGGFSRLSALHKAFVVASFVMIPLCLIGTYFAEYIVPVGYQASSEWYERNPGPYTREMQEQRDAAVDAAEAHLLYEHLEGPVLAPTAFSFAYFILGVIAFTLLIRRAGKWAWIGLAGSLAMLLTTGLISTHHDFTQVGFIWTLAAAVLGYLCLAHGKRQGLVGRQDGQASFMRTEPLKQLPRN